MCLLTVSVGLPYFVLSATGPLVQAWFSRAFAGRSPYRLYALSNVGSLVGLLGYPFFVEPRFALGSANLVLGLRVCGLRRAVRIGCFVRGLGAAPEVDETVASRTLRA